MTPEEQRRWRLILGAHAVMRHQAHRDPQGRTDRWLTAMRARRPTPIVAVALANKTARIAWAIMARGEVYRSEPLAP